MLDTEQFRSPPLWSSLDWRSSPCVQETGIVHQYIKYMVLCGLGHTMGQGSSWTTGSPSFSEQVEVKQSKTIYSTMVPVPSAFGKWMFHFSVTACPHPKQEPKGSSWYLSQEAPCSQSISELSEPSLTCSGAGSWWKHFWRKANEPTQPSSPPQAIHSCCGLTVHDCNFLSTLLILLLGTYLVPYSYPSHWWHLCTRSPTLHISLPCHPKSSCPPTLWR